MVFFNEKKLLVSPNLNKAKKKKLHIRRNVVNDKKECGSYTKITYPRGSPLLVLNGLPCPVLKSKPGDFIYSLCGNITE